MTQSDPLKLFHSISDKEYELIQKNLKTRTFGKGEYIITPGQVQKELYFVKKGVQMSYFESDKKTHVVAFTYPPDLCAIPESFSFQKPSNTFLVCLDHSEMDYLTYDNLQQLLDESHQIERLFRKMTEAVLAGVLIRHMELHSLNMEERYKSFCRRSPHLLQLVPHKYIASYLGIDPTNFSKLYNNVRI